jgi:hypothetical protein
MKTKKQQLKQKIIALTVVTFMFFMVFNTVELRDVFAIGANTTLTQNFTAGTLSLEASASAGFNDVQVGTAINSKANLVVVNMRDYRGDTGAWAVTGNITSQLQTTDPGYNYIPNTTVAWNPTTAALTTPDSSNLNGNLRGTAGYFGGAVRNLMAFNSGNGMGNYQLSGTELNIVYNGRADQIAGSYVGTLELTIT